ncbi:MetQ/NlpA family ABC transporter substrate-binding protein [Weissella viridescens]|nr:MetQ/NlpA family ABC transporter substrate-binding protein [Weissella viridescens]MBX4172496.1 MetQ/NlpA family ABC transporter substrate-binding protein [Weissella viridescens]MCB6840791.1 MetQ/NlpA family ABC transporter substrate-binding protein [Weissella viridescens]MCB6847492.1 MetQ/NlpA family ABC transporter substrate-binding protein [Weissella viridescens]WJI91841.1 MetQ/NlpA family ABC transporter substrate-binding protein [Weissella viridescens]SUP61542.1 D-methionine-binding lip
MNKGVKWVIGIGLVAVVAGGFYAIKQHDKVESKTVTVGIVGDSDRELWEYVKKDAKKDYNVDVKLKTFTDYVQPNKALADGDIDLNAFQTVNYFETQNKNYNGKLLDIGKTYVTPIRLYSDKFKKLGDLPKGATISIPNDPSNAQRALDLLEKAGLLKYNHSVKLPGAKDVTDNPKNIKIKEVQSDQSVSTLKSVDAAVINTNYALDAKLNVDKALYVESVDQAHKGYFNLIATRKGSENKQAYQDVVKAYQTEKTVKHMKDLYGNAEQPAWGKYAE